jgi:hypothetical protein
MRTGRIYKIISGQGDECYVGSTFQSLTYRWRDHKQGYRSYKKDNNNNISSYDLFDKYGVDNCAIILIKEYEICDRRHMEAYEQLWINKLNCINKQNSFCIKKLYKKQYREQNKDKIIQRNKQYYEQNKDKYKEHNKQYREQNKDKCKEHNKQWREQNKDKCKEHNKQYREQNKDKINQRKRERREQNKEVIRQKDKQYYEQNKDKIKEKSKQYYEQNKDKINQRHKERYAAKKAATIQS